MCIYNFHIAGDVSLWQITGSEIARAKGEQFSRHCQITLETVVNFAFQVIGIESNCPLTALPTEYTVNTFFHYLKGEKWHISGFINLHFFDYTWQLSYI